MRTNIKLNLKKIMLASISLFSTFILFFSLRRLFLIISLKAKIGRKTTIHRSIRFFDFGKMAIGKNSTINTGCYLDNRGGLTIGNNVNISHDVKIYTMGHDVNDPLAKIVSRAVTLDDNVWVFPNVIIMPGVTIGNGGVVYPGSVVTKDIPPFEIWAGNPAKFIKHRNKEVTYNADFPIWFGI